MGLFSFCTSDTDESIPHIHGEGMPYTVHMIDNQGNVYTENDYEGYGVFGGKDIYELIAEMNGHGSNRDVGISMVFRNNPSGDFATAFEISRVLTPRLVRDKDLKWSEVPCAKDCPDQGGITYEPRLSCTK